MPCPHMETDGSWNCRFDCTFCAPEMFDVDNICPLYFGDVDAPWRADL